MELALRSAYKGSAAGEGGPFGACIVKKGKVLAVAHNRVLKSKDPTQHAEVRCIGLASKKLGTHVLKGCEIYSTTEPCPRCFSAVHWAQIDKVYFGTTVADVQRLGFNELTISNKTMKRIGKSRLKLAPGFEKAACAKLLKFWKSIPNAKTY